MNIVFKVMVYNFIFPDDAAVAAKWMLEFIKENTVLCGKFCGEKAKVKGCSVPYFDYSYHRMDILSGAVFQVAYEADDEQSLDEVFPNLVETGLEKLRSAYGKRTVITYSVDDYQPASIFAKITKKTDKADKVLLCADGYISTCWRKSSVPIMRLEEDLLPVNEIVMEEKHE